MTGGGGRWCEGLAGGPEKLGTQRGPSGFVGETCVKSNRYRNKPWEGEGPLALVWSLKCWSSLVQLAVTLKEVALAATRCLQCSGLQVELSS